MTAKNTSVMADKVFVGTIDSNTKLSVKVIDQLNLKSEPQYLKQEDDDEDGVTDVRIAGSENLLAVLCGGVEKVCLWNLQDEAWLENLPIQSVAPKEDFVLQNIAVSTNLLAVTVVCRGWPRVVQTLFWHLDTVQRCVSAPQFLGKVCMPEMYGYPEQVYINGKFCGIVLECGTQFLYAERSKLFSGENSRVADLAKVADPVKPGGLWRQVKLCNFSLTDLFLDPGNSNHIAVIEDTGIDQGLYFLNLASGECITSIRIDDDGLDPFGWKGDNFFFLKKVEEDFQMVMFDPALFISKGEIEIVENGAACLFPGLILQSDEDFKIDNVNHYGEIRCVDFYGFVLVDDRGHLFSAAFD
jgi:hypothetical protein